MSKPIKQRLKNKKNSIMVVKVKGAYRMESYKMNVKDEHKKAFYRKMQEYNPEVVRC